MDSQNVAASAQTLQDQQDSGLASSNSVSNSDKIAVQIQLLTKQMESQGVVLGDDDIEGLESYLATKVQWEEVHRRLADS